MHLDFWRTNCEAICSLLKRCLGGEGDIRLIDLGGKFLPHSTPLGGCVEWGEKALMSTKLHHAKCQLFNQLTH